ncbi:hypothetical protein [Sulfitobacter donghicola]|uniref:Orotidine 5-phosphate decarboxylase n=1 Tax=Sulfitobacter donghicola DSW-25 = KCTC 12864 = JCM 14565 TaxID=1300350 RepID=A0A073IY83_9RHOB|nr:hypothetical protein [Sulfitobacter donghicola]KEJ90347.1 hypothetical protein DSW25_00025 [Sulfitobacter donghicola DSW-25 = KCTC 12864 = JCM 14565]
MKQTKIQLNDVIYNAATQCFEALVTVSDDQRKKRYACAIEAPINMTFEQAAEGLKKQAMRKHVSGRSLFSQVLPHRPSVRAGRAAFDPKSWLEQLGFGSQQNAA